MRATGKTFRNILTALKLASEGNKVYYLTGKPHLKSWYRNRAADILTSYLPPDSISLKPDEIFIKDAGSVRFCDRDFFEQKNSRGIKVDATINDD